MIDQPERPQEEEELLDESSMDNAAEPERIKKKAARLKKTEDESGDFWRSALSGVVGRREIWGILTAAHAFEERFACGPNGFPQVEATWFHAGEQALGLRIYHMLMRIDRAAVMKMHDENDAAFAKPKRPRSGMGE